MIYCIITIDYEDVFVDTKKDEQVGCLNVYKNVIDPSYAISSFFLKYKIPVTFFCDVPEILAFKKYDEAVYADFCDQMRSVKMCGHDIQLHFHPDWLYFKKENKNWISTRDFRLPYSEIYLSNYEKQLKECIEEISVYSSIIAYRAGGYAISPIKENFKTLFDIGIRIDSSFGWKGSFRNDVIVKNITYPIPFVLYDIIEVPICRIKKLRWDMSKNVGGVHCIETMIEKFAIIDNDIFIVMIGHCKQNIFYEELSQVIDRLLKKDNVKFIDFHKFLEIWETNI